MPTEAQNPGKQPGIESVRNRSLITKLSTLTRSVRNLFLYSSVYLAVIAMAEVVLVSELLDLPLTPAPIVAGLLTFAVYGNDRLADLETDAKTAPARTAFVRRYQDAFYVFGAIAYGLAVALSVLGGPLSFGLSLLPGVFWIIAGYTYLLGLLGALPLLKLVTSRVDPFRGQSLALLLGLLAPWVTNIPFLMGALPSAGVDPTPIAFAVSGLAYLGALTRSQLFGANPTPIRHARNSLFQQMQQGALVLDTHDHIVDMNDQATTALQTTASDALGRPLEQISPDLSALGSTAQAGQTIYRPPG